MQQPSIEVPDFRVDRLKRAAMQMHGYAYPRPLELTLVEEAQTGRQKGNDRCRPMLRPRKRGCSARLVVVFEKTRKLVLIVKPRQKMLANRARIAFLQPIVQPLVVAIGETLLLQGPFEVPIDF